MQAQAQQNPMPHIPVMLPEVLAALSPAEDEIYVDATFGAGGYSRAILGAATCRVIGIDRDPNVQRLADALARDFPGHFLFLAGRFSTMISLLERAGVARVDGIVMDLGVSSMQLDERERGFSFMADAPLDMRMGSSLRTAADIISDASESELADILYRYGEERASRAIAKAIIAARAIAPITTTQALATLIAGVRGVERRAGVHPATRSFQALRIAVNEELQELELALASALSLLKPGGRLVVVTFHSLEDRIVKQFFQLHSGKAGAVSRHDPRAFDAALDASPAPFELIMAKAQHPSQEEISSNHRARSAKLRALRKKPELFVK
jgi:16S rRNA (cytosine1402-N4)-methyltransferase